MLLIGPSGIDNLKKVSDVTWRLSTPLFYIHSIGFFSRFSIQLPKLFPIVDTHPDPTSTQDLRLLRPWPELLEYMEKQTEGLEAMENHDHGHVPYLLLLLFYLERWKEEHDGKAPENYKEKVAFREMVRAAARTDNPEGGEENFDEAVAAVVKSLNPPATPSGFAEIVVLPECRLPQKSVTNPEFPFVTLLTVNSQSANFWVIANAIHWFMCRHDNVLPLPGALPDMKAQSKDYVALQNLYRSKAQEDLALVTEKVRCLEKKSQRPNPIDVKEIEAFCKGAAFIKLIQGQRILLTAGVGDYNLREDKRFQALDCQIKEENANDDEPTPGMEPSLLAALVAFRAFDVAFEIGSDQPFPRLDSSQQLLDGSLAGIIGSFVDPRDSKADEEKTSAAAASPSAMKQRALDVGKELARAGGAELHNISALTGGAVAQEVIKVVTKQYVPVDNTWVFDGVKSRSEIFRI